MGWPHPTRSEAMTGLLLAACTILPVLCARVALRLVLLTMAGLTLLLRPKQRACHESRLG